MHFELVLLIVIFGLFFDYTNGFHDSANVVSTVIATGVLKPVTAIVLASLLNAIGATQTSRIAQTITTGLIAPQESTQLLILSALIGAIIWNILTARLGLPSSSSYALIGGLLGVVLINKGTGAVLWNGVIYKVIIPMIVSPFVGFFIAYIFMKILYFFTSVEKRHSSIFRKLQLFSASLVALSHGFNDAQKSMAIITLGLFSSGLLSAPNIPLWVIFSCALVMGLGTGLGGYRIIKTVGFEITSLEPFQGFAAETSASIVILSAGFLGMPISSTHMIVGSIAGVGSAKKIKAVQWLMANKLVMAWILTMPAAGLVASSFYLFFRSFLKFFYY